MLSATNSPWSSLLCLGSQAREEENPLWALLWKLSRACQLSQPRLQWTKPNTARSLGNFLHHNFFYFWSKATWTSPSPAPNTTKKGWAQPSLPLHTKPRVFRLPHLSTGCYSSCLRLLLASPPPPFSLSSFVLNTGQVRGQQQSWLCQTWRSNTLGLCRRQARELASPYHLSQQFFTFPSYLLQKSYIFSSPK